MGNKSRSNINWLLIENIEQLKQYTSSWKELLDVTDASLFSSPQWLLNWIDIYWQDSWQLKAIVGLKNNQLVVIAPLYIQKSNNLFSLTSLMPLGQGEPEESEVLSEYQDIIIHPNENNLHAQLATQITKIECDQICWNALLGDSNWIKILSYLKNSTYKKYTIESGQRYLLTNTDNYIATLSKNNRSKWKKCQNKLTTLHAKFIWVQEKDHEHLWQALISLHQARWHNKGKSGAFMTQDFIDFHQNFQKNNITKMSALIINEEPIAINYYLQDSNTLYFYQSGWSENTKTNLSPGFSLHIWSIINNPLLNYDFMVDDSNDSYKAKFGCTQIPITNIKINLSPLKITLQKILNKLNVFS